ncbi:hypothetical protein AM380_11570 [Morganella morganii]|uniref:Uncharacterized protein n=1 Tax=Morganella morganii TaxID=582 RepID=A0AAU8ZLT7_MORMO|nr:hypothetical protein AM380_11570 [Morganella morganii]
MAVLVSFVHPGHILVYAPGDVLTSPPCHRRNDLADSLLRHPPVCGCVGCAQKICFYLRQTLCTRQMPYRRAKSVERQGWRDPSEQGCDSAFSFCTVSVEALWQNRFPGILPLPPCHKPDDSADSANRDVSAAFRFAGYPAARV